MTGVVEFTIASGAMRPTSSRLHISLAWVPTGTLRKDDDQQKDHDCKGPRGDRAAEFEPALGDRLVEEVAYSCT